MSPATPPPSYAFEVPPNIKAPPAYSAPTEVTVGMGLANKPFVSAAQLKDHLTLLHAFSELKIKVGGMADNTVPCLPHDSERRWAWFVGLAVERFEKWCKALRPSHSEKGMATVLPPIDVLMVWHSYLLNPRWHAEDISRSDALEGLQSAEFAMASSIGDDLGDLLANEPAKQRVDNWVQLTATPFDPFAAAMQMATREIACPKCQGVVYAPYMTETGTGYLQYGFAMKCPREACAFGITKETLALRKFATDLARSRLVDVLAGTLHTPTNIAHHERARAVKVKMLNSSSLMRPAANDLAPISDAAYADLLMKTANYKLEELRTKLAMNMKGKGGKLIDRIMSAYVDDKMFSVELVGAVLRQGSFVAKMYDLQWTQVGFFDSPDDEVKLQRIIARYHAFLTLMLVSPGSFFVPTLDIDLAWHTHQLMASKYSRDTLKHVGRFIDHDDNVDGSELSSSFETTCRAWEDRYGVQYTHCGLDAAVDVVADVAPVAVEEVQTWSWTSSRRRSERAVEAAGAAVGADAGVAAAEVPVLERSGRAVGAAEAGAGVVEAVAAAVAEVV
ncbi:hypothetical protein B0H15DRAFT_957375 [Mycena belliarum]|uniref:Uncharacterized protein n=1 Tax=Mycena belliarum TaxID=1033014 RepID=A0AAD6TST1_9AGAR|nr:hypothetical protein B0H15DRAFT_957375 [Mycena belliae]